MTIPSVRLNVAGVQYGSASRYQTWYERTSPATTPPATCSGVGAPALGSAPTPPTGNVTPRRVSEPVRQNNPSPNGKPVPLLVPCTNSPGPASSDAARLNVSVAAHAPAPPVR